MYIIFALDVSPRMLTLTVLSHEQETTWGLAGLGLKRTHEIHSEWLSSWPIVYLHSPRVFHSLLRGVERGEEIRSVVAASKPSPPRQLTSDGHGQTR